MSSVSAMEMPFGIHDKRFSELKDSTKAEITDSRCLTTDVEDGGVF